MTQLRIPAVFMRGGTSKAIVFKASDLPRDRALWDRIFLAAIGSPDPYMRQLDGMGGGLSSVSKVCVVAPSMRPDADIDYTFAQVQVAKARVDYTANCGNMSAAMGPFAVDEGLVSGTGSEAVVRVYNTNTRKLILARFAVNDGVAAVDGDLEIPGVAGSGAPVRLEFLEPGGATTGKLLPTGNVVDLLEVPGFGRIHASLVDAANATCFVSASEIGLTGMEMPAAIDGSPKLLAKLESIRKAAAVAMGIAATLEEAGQKPSVPFIAVMSPPQDARTLSGESISRTAVDFTARMLSNGQAHRALSLTVTLCMAVAARIRGTIVHAQIRAGDSAKELRIAMPSGVLTVAATVTEQGGIWHAEQGAFFRTQRRLFDGHVYVRASQLDTRSIVKPLRTEAAGETPIRRATSTAS